MKIQSVYNTTSSIVNLIEQGHADEAMVAQASTLVNLGLKQEDLQTKLNEVKSELDAIIKEPAPSEFLDDTIEAMKAGCSLKEYCEENDRTIWDASLYIMPTSDAWKARKKEAKAIKEARNLEKFDDTIDFLADAKRNDDLVVSTCKIKAKKSGGYSWRMAGSIAGQKQEKLTATEAFKKLQARINNSSERV